MESGMTSSAPVLVVATVLLHLSLASLTPPSLTMRPTMEPDIDMVEWYELEVPQRHLLAVDQSSLSGNSNWRVTIEDALNNWRRMVSASNMHYTSWDDRLEHACSSMFSSCQVKSSIKLDDSKYMSASGLFGAMSLDSDIVSELRRLLEQGVTGKYYSQLITWSLTGVGCAASQQQCVIKTSNGTILGPVVPYACIFAYTSAVSENVYAVTGVNCSMCNTGDLWCDDGLCRGRDSCRPGDLQCERCQGACSDCSEVTTLPDCPCLCYYDDGSQRCQATTESSPYQPICHGTDPNINAHLFHAPAWVTAIIVSSCVLLSIAFAMSVACCVHRHKSHRRQGTFPPPPEYEQPTTEHEDQFFPASFPPPYLDGKPPEYSEAVSYQGELSGNLPRFEDQFSSSPDVEASNDYETIALSVNHVTPMMGPDGHDAGSPRLQEVVIGMNLADTDGEAITFYDNLVCSTNDDERQ